MIKSLKDQIEGVESLQSAGSRSQTGGDVEVQVKSFERHKQVARSDVGVAGSIPYAWTTSAAQDLDLSQGSCRGSMGQG